MILFTDVDGVLTGAKVTYDSRGEVSRSFNVRDGEAIRRAKEYGIEIIWITRSDSPAIRARAEFLNVDCIQSTDKAKTIRRLLSERAGGPNIPFMYIGDDLIDIEAMKMALHRACPKDAHPKVIEIMTSFDLILKSKGGDGCLSEYVDYLIETNEIKPC